MKWDMGQVTIRNTHVHDNQCKGLWADGNSHDALIEHNLVENNTDEGILYEISQDAVIRNNVIYATASRAPAGTGLGYPCRQLQRGGVRQPAVRQLQRDHGHPARPARRHAGPPAGRPPGTLTT